MAKKYIENTTGQVMYVGGKMIPPGEGREIDEAQLPAEHRDAPAALVEEPVLDGLTDADLLELLEGNVDQVTSALDGLDAEALIRLAALEAERSHPRVTIERAIEAERLKRADAALSDSTDTTGQD